MQTHLSGSRINRGGKGGPFVGAEFWLIYQWGYGGGFEATIEEKGCTYGEVIYCLILWVWWS